MALCSLALIRVHGLRRCALFSAPSKQDRRLVTKPVNDTKLAGRGPLVVELRTTLVIFAGRGNDYVMRYSRRETERCWQNRRTARCYYICGAKGNDHYQLLEGPAKERWKSYVCFSLVPRRFWGEKNGLGTTVHACVNHPKNSSKHVVLESTVEESESLYGKHV